MDSPTLVTAAIMFVPLASALGVYALLRRRALPPVRAGCASVVTGLVLMMVVLGVLLITTLV